VGHEAGGLGLGWEEEEVRCLGSGGLSGNQGTRLLVCVGAYGEAKSDVPCVKGQPLCVEYDPFFFIKHNMYKPVPLW
jgi:hypothetical protein